MEPLTLDFLTALTKLAMPGMQVGRQGDTYPAGLQALEAASLADPGDCTALYCLRRLEVTEVNEGNKECSRLTQVHELRLTYKHAIVALWESHDWPALAPILQHLSVSGMDSFKADPEDGGETMPDFDDLGRLTALTSLEIDSLELETSMEGFADCLSSLTRLQQLRVASVEYADTHFFMSPDECLYDSDYEDCVTDKEVDGLLRLLVAIANLPSLRNLQLEDYPFCDAVGLLQSAAQLTSLSLKNCMVQDEGMARLVQGCTALRGLSLKDEEDATDRTMAAVAKQLQQLTRLQLAGLPKVTDAGVGKLSALRQLQQLEVQECRLVTAAGRRKALGQPALRA